MGSPLLYWHRKVFVPRFVPTQAARWSSTTFNLIKHHHHHHVTAPLQLEIIIIMESDCTGKFQWPHRAINDARRVFGILQSYQPKFLQSVMRHPNCKTHNSSKRNLLFGPLANCTTWTIDFEECVKLLTAKKDVFHPTHQNQLLTPQLHNEMNGVLLSCYLFFLPRCKFSESNWIH